MAQRNTTPLSFSSVQYLESNVDKRWYVSFEQSSPYADLAAMAATLDQAIANIFQSANQNGANTVSFGSGVGSVDYGDVTLAVRIPQTTRLIDLTIKDGSAGTTLGTIPYDIYVSGRSDKKYTEIIDWVKVADETGKMADSITNVYLPKDASGLYVTGDADTVHNKFFPFYSSWVKIVFHDVKTIDGVDQLLIERIKMYNFHEDFGATEIEQNPTVTMVFPKDDSKWLPSQSVYFTARVKEPDTDACHFRFEIYKESGDSSGYDVGDTLMYTIDSNALNLDGSDNENYKRSWLSLPVKTANAVNSVYLPGYPADSNGANPRSILIVPIEGSDGTAGLGTQSVSLSNIKLYDNVGNVLKWDNAIDKLTNPGTGDLGTPLSTGIVVPTKEQRGQGFGWLIKLPAQTKFNRIDFVSGNSAYSAPTKVNIYYNPVLISEAATGASRLTEGVWSISGVADGSFSGPDFEANIEFCWPKTTANVGTYKSNVTFHGFKGTDGYLEISPNAPANFNPDDYNPDRIGVGIGETNVGDWAKVHKFAGVLVGPSYATVDSDLGTETNSTQFGDSPIPVNAASSPATDAFVTDADRTVYVRVALPDPYRDGEIFYARCLVWDGQTEIST
jgi:hypothetical protein